MAKLKDFFDVGVNQELTYEQLSRMYQHIFFPPKLYKSYKDNMAQARPTLTATRRGGMIYATGGMWGAAGVTHHNTIEREIEAVPAPAFVHITPEQLEEVNHMWETETWNNELTALMEEEDDVEVNF